MRTNLRILMLLVYILGSLADRLDVMKAYRDECIAETSSDMENPLESDYFEVVMPLTDCDNYLKQLFYCVLEKQGLIKDGVIQAAKFIQLIDELLLPYYRSDVADAVTSCQHKTGDNPVELMYNTAVCVQDYLSEMDS